MTIKSIKYIFTIVLCWSGLSLATPFQDLDNFDSYQLSDNLFTLKSHQSNTNIGVFIGKKSIVLIDPVVGRENNSRLVQAIKKLTDKPIKYVINTHNHMDHNGANTFYRNLGATIVAHGIHPEENQLTFKETYTIDMGNEKIDLLHIASHSAHDVLIHFSTSNVIFMGDTYMHDMYPHAYIGGSKGLINVANKTLSLANNGTKIVTAHGRFTTSKSEFLDFKTNAVAWYQRIDSLNKKGLDINSIAQDEVLQKISTKFRPLSEANFKKRIKQTVEAESN